MKTSYSLMVSALLAFQIASPATAQTATGDMQQQMLQQLQNMPADQRAQLIENVSQNAQAIQTCIDNAGGMDALEKLKTVTSAHMQQVKSFCASGKREEAQAYAEDAAQEIMHDVRVKKLQECSRLALQNMPELSQLAENGGLEPGKHVCD